jgi:hypothetical protein
MTSLRCILAAGALIICAPPSFAGNCEDVYANNVRNRTFAESDYTTLNTLYDNLCSSSQRKSSLSWDSSMNIIVDSLPMGMTGNAKSTNEKADAFCHAYSTLRYDTSHRSLAKDEVVTSALNAYNACKEIESRTGVVVTHKFADPDSIIVNFDFKNTTSFLRIDGVRANNLVCRSNEAPGNRKILNENSNFEMRSNFVITCGRTHPQSNPRSYVPGSLAIGTNITSYAISLPADSIYDNSLASDATAKITGLQKSLDSVQSEKSDLSSKLSEANKKIKGVRMEQHAISIEENNGGGYEYYGCNTKPEDVRDKDCNGAFQSSISKALSSAGGHCGHTFFVITCLYLGN